MVMPPVWPEPWVPARECLRLDQRGKAYAPTQKNQRAPMAGRVAYCAGEPLVICQSLGQALSGVGPSTKGRGLFKRNPGPLFSQSQTAIVMQAAFVCQAAAGCVYLLVSTL